VDEVRWVILNPEIATLSIWDKPAAQDLQAPGSAPRLLGSQARAPRKVFVLSKLVEVTTNRAFRNIFLEFEGVSNLLCLTANNQQDFERWTDALAQYGVGP
jgi:hypothetical protein